MTVHATFLDLDIDVEELAERIAPRLGWRCALTPLNVKCTYPVFRGEARGHDPVFVKVGTTEEWRKTADVLSRVAGCALFAPFLVTEPLDYRGHAVFVSAWRTSCVVFPEDMSPQQVDGLVAGCVELSRVLQRVREFAPIASSPAAPERLYAHVADYARRHPVAACALKGLLSLPAERRTFGARALAVIHGDFHSKNIGFSGNRLASVYDFDQLTEGLPASDLANVLMERFSCLHLSRAARRRLAEAAHRAVSASPWPREDFEIAANVFRLRFAARRLEKHPNAPWAALDVLRRDRKMRAFLDCL